MTTQRPLLPTFPSLAPDARTSRSKISHPTTIPNTASPIPELCPAVSYDDSDAEDDDHSMAQPRVALKPRRVLSYPPSLPIRLSMRVDRCTSTSQRFHRPAPRRLHSSDEIRATDTLWCQTPRSRDGTASVALSPPPCLRRASLYEEYDDLEDEIPNNLLLPRF